MSIVEDLWNWIQDPLEKLKQSILDEPGRPWETRREEFRQGLGIQEPGQHPVTEQMFRHLDDLTEDERTTQIRSGQFESTARTFAEQHAASQQADQGSGQGSDQQAAISGPGYDERAWQDYLQSSAGQWDGRQETWSQFTQWFLYYANDNGLKDPAAALISYLDPLSPGERIAVLSQYGVTISPPAQPVAQSVAQSVAQPVQDSGAEQGGIEQGGIEQGGDADEVAIIMDELLAENPQFAAIPEERRMEILNRVFRELQDTAD